MILRLAIVFALANALNGATPLLRVSNSANQPVEISTAKTAATVVVFISALCPVSNAYHDRYKQLVTAFKDMPVQFVFINANDNETLAEVNSYIRAAELPFPVYKDWKNSVADKLGASMTPEAFVLNAKGEVLYHGAIDDSKNEARVKVTALRDAIGSTVAGKPVVQKELKAFGCTIHRYRKIS